MAVVGYKAHKKADEGRAWDGAGAKKRLLEWAGGPEKENVDWGKYQQGFAWYDAENRENAGAYKLPHSDIMDGAICDVWAGVSAAMGALLGARGGADIPDDERKGVYNHLKQHYGQWDKAAPEFRDVPLDPYSDEEGEERGRSVARADLVSAEAPEVAGALALINQKFAHRPLEAAEVYLLPPAEMSNQNVDAYFTRMGESSLRNYLRDALAGVPLMNSHRTGYFNAELPLGQSYNAILAEGQESLRFLTWFYMLRGVRVNSVETDHLIRAIEGGVVRDVSIGFHAGRYVCGLCGKELVAPWMIAGAPEGEFCEHVPGVEYDGQVAWAWVEDARLVEGSLVYAGATPGAVLLKARWAAQQGLLPRGEAAVLEDRWGVRIAGGRTYLTPAERDSGPSPSPLRTEGEGSGRAVVEVMTPGWPLVQGLQVPDRGDGVVQPRQERDEKREVEMTKEEIRALVEQKAPELMQRLAEAENPVEALLEAWADARQMRGEQEERTRARIAELEALAELGRDYRTALVAETVAARVRAQGPEGFTPGEYQRVLEQQSLEYIRSELASWEKAAREVFEPGRPVGKIVSRGTAELGSRGDGKQRSKEPGKQPRAYKA